MMNLSSNFVVGISQRIDSVERRDELRDALDQKLVQWLIKAGFLSVAIPNILSSTDTHNNIMIENWLQVVQPGALILSGGNDIGDYVTRDTTERYLLSWAEKNKIPVLGICRGMQMMAAWAGVKLKTVDGHVKTRHKLEVVSENGEWPSNVNSYHNLCLSSCPDGFEVVAKSEDDSIEAIRHVHLPWEGWMWHPEREASFSEQDINRVKRLFCEE